MTRTDATLPELELDRGTAVVADLHLDVGPQGAEPREFLAFLQRMRGRPRLVVLGDLFDAWIGPAQMELDSARRVVDALRALVDSGTRIDIVQGNRDFLLERRFEERSGACVHRSGFVGVLPSGSRALFVHGDEFCTLDVGYQRLKRVVRSPAVRWTAPRLPRSVALSIARRLRRASVQALEVKPAREKEQQVAAAAEWAAAHRCATVVCGHAHHLRDEPVRSGAGREARWIVLDAFGGPRDLLEVTGAGTLETRSSAGPGAR